MLIKRILFTLVTLVMSTALFLPKSAQAVTLTLSDMQAVMSSVVDPASGNETLSLLVDSSRFGSGGIAGGIATVSGGPPDVTLWLVDPFAGGPPDDNMPAISFLFDVSGTLLGVDDPFRIFMGNPPDDGMPGADPTIIGLLDFSNVTASLGSLNLSGVQVLGVDAAGGLTGDVLFDVAPFTVQAVPVPAAFILFGSGFLCLLGAAKRKR